VAIVVALVGGYLLFRGGGPLGGPPVTKSVILLQISDSTGDAVADALLVTDRGSAQAAAGKSAAVVIPSQMVVNMLGFGSQPFGGNMAQSVPAADKETVADVFGVDIDGVWRMDEITFAGLIDEIGGIKLTATAAVPAVTAPPTAAAVPAGAGKLTGGQAIAYGTYTAKGEPAIAQGKRFGQVVEGLLAALPTDADAMTAYLNHLGLVDNPALPDSRLSPILAALAASTQAGSFTANTLPLRTDGSNELDSQAAAPIVASLLGGALPAVSPGQVSRVLVENGTGDTGSQSQAVLGDAEAKLSNAGYTYLDGAAVARRATSVIEVDTQDRKAAAIQIAQALSIPEGSVQVVPGLASIGDVTVVLGEDWPALAGISLPTAN
jgi:anionic cell wall polymer biosynthesis LytR-Cps2A-Psr (LCP) family protein